jgi:pimeloyl-ACP methyl ester carboxylesterase
MSGFLYWIFVNLSLMLMQSDGYNSHFVETTHGRIHYLESSGQGPLPPMVLLHGIGCQSSDLYPVFQHLRAVSRKVILVDLPAHGKSEIPVEKLSFAEIQADFYQGMDRILASEEPVILFGNSLGGWESVLYADHNPAELAGLILVSPAGAQATEQDYTRLRQIFAHDSVAEPYSLLPLLFNKKLKNPSSVAMMIQARFSEPRVQSLMSRLSPEHTLEPQQLAKLKMPTLLIWGQQDRIFPNMLPFFKAHLPPQTEILEPPLFTHSPYLEGTMDRELHLMMTQWAWKTFKPNMPLPPFSVELAENEINLLDSL